jgi:queuine tRNA-ribosyltransferase
MLGPILLSIHNLTYYQRLLCQAREAIERGEFEAFHRSKLAAWGIAGGGGETPAANAAAEPS